jgi:hypothetical protein
VEGRRGMGMHVDVIGLAPEYSAGLPLEVPRKTPVHKCRSRRSPQLGDA